MALISRSRSKPPILLELDLSHPLLEQEPDDPIAKLRSRGKPRLRPVLRALHEAGKDPRVVGLVAKVGDTSMSLARAQELRTAVAALAAGGKPTVAWAETFGESGNGTIPYLLASAFGTVWLQPTGELNVLGLAAEVTFVRGVLDKLDVDPLMDQRYEYKNAGDRVSQTKFTPAHREASDRLTESAYEQITAAIAADRKLSVADVQAAIDRAPLFADDGRDLGLVDKLGYRDEVYAAIRREVGGDVQLLFADRWTPAAGAVRRIVKQARDKKAPGIALVEGYGGIVTGRNRRSPLMGNVMGSDTVTAAIRAAVRDEKVRAIVFRVDSPGGSAVASDTIWREVGCAQESGKPVIVSMGSVAGSGGYYVACGADTIVAEPGTLTGSIGVVGGKLDTSGLTDRLGLSYDRVKRGEQAAMYSMHRSFTDTERERLEAWLDRVYADFTGKVAQGRRMSPEAVHEIAKGRVWTGADALSNGLVDTLGGLREAVMLARSRAGLPEDAPLRPAVSVPALARLKPPRSTEDPRVSMSVGTLAWEPGWGSFAGIAAALGMPAYGPVTMPGVRFS
jgi:protease-4